MHQKIRPILDFDFVIICQSLLCMHQIAKLISLFQQLRTTALFIISYDRHNENNFTVFKLSLYNASVYILKNMCAGIFTASLSKYFVFILFT